MTRPTTGWFPVDLIRSELLTLRVTRAPFLTGVGLFLASVLAGAASVSESREIVAVAAMFAGIVSYGFGLLTVAQEFQHGTATLTYLTAPRRGTVFTAKALTAGGFGAAAGLVAPLVALLVYALRRDHAPYDVDMAVTYLLGVFAAAVAGLMGACVGSALRLPVRALSLSLGWVIIVEGFIGHLTAMLPFGAFVATLSEENQVLGFVALVGWAVVGTTAASVIAARRDV